MSIGIIGDYSPGYPSQHATNDALQHSINKLGAQINYEWIPTTSIPEQLDSIVKKYKGFWIAPGIPDSDNGVIQIIRYAREHNIPVIATCGGFQTMMIEFAKHKLMIENAGHEERNPDASTLIINKLACTLVGKAKRVKW